MKSYFQAWQLFLEGKFWEAHEIWEDLWRAGDPESRPALQALIQICALGIKLERDERLAAERLRRRALELLTQCSPEVLQKFHLSAEELPSLLKEWRGDPEEFRRLRLVETHEVR